MIWLNIYVYIIYIYIHIIFCINSQSLSKFVRCSALEKGSNMAFPNLATGFHMEATIQPFNRDLVLEFGGKNTIVATSG